MKKDNKIRRLEARLIQEYDRIDLINAKLKSINNLRQKGWIAELDDALDFYNETEAELEYFFHEEHVI